MSTTGIRTTRLALALQAYGFELRLWKEQGEREWGSTVREGDAVVQSKFEEDNLVLAKLHLLGEARSRAMNQSGDADLPGCDTLLDSWKPVKLTNP
jgi:hypothetical protein